MENLTERKIETSRYEFGTLFSECLKHREFDGNEIVSMKTAAYDKAVGMMDIFKSVIWNKKNTVDDIFSLCAQITGYEDENDEFASESNSDSDFNAEEEALKKMTTKLAHRYSRYCKSELREKRENFALKMQKIDIEVGNYIIPVMPQALFVKDGIANVKYIDAVFYADKKAPAGVTDKEDILDEVRKWDANANSNNVEYERIDPLRLKHVHMWKDQFLGLKYIEHAINNPLYKDLLGLSDGDTIIARGNIYYMEMKSADNTCTDFFDGNSNIITLQESYIVGQDNLQNKTDLDLLFADYAEKHELGMEAEKCNKNDCKYCSNKASCYFQKSPVKLELEETGTSCAKGDFEPTPAQKKLISIESGYYLCIARAGSGKTASMKNLVMELLHKGAKLNEIFMTTFTNNGVREFKDRVLAELKKEDPTATVDDAKITTFHGFALEICRDNYEELGFTKMPREINVVDKGRIVEELVTEHRFIGTEKLYQKNFEGVLNIIDVAILLFDLIGEHPEYLDDLDAAENYMAMLPSRKKGLVTSTTIDELIDIYPTYCEELKKENVILFSDMEPMMHQILDAHPGYLDKYGFKYVILDEFQDSNDIQMETVKKLAACKSVQMIVAVGDDGQSIYGFRDAAVDNIIDFAAKLGKPVEKIAMLENWRSTPEILDLADNELALNVNRTEERTVAGRPASGIEPIVRGFHSEEKEYGYIVEKIKENYEKGVPYHKQAVLARTNAELVKILSYLSAENIPYVLKNPMKYVDNSRVQALLAFTENAFWQPETTSGYFAYLSALYDGDMLDILTPEELQEQIDALKQQFLYISDMELEEQRAIYHKYLDQIRGGDEIYESFLDEYLYKYEDIEEELRFIVDFKKYGSKMTKKMEQDYEGVVLTTAHSSKGLEWNIVYNTISCYDSASLHTKKHFDELEETRRLLYVSMTRARDQLYVTGRYVIDGTKSASASSGGPSYNQFLKELYDLTGQDYQPIDLEELQRKRDKQRERNKKYAERRKMKSSKEDFWARMNKGIGNGGKSGKSGLEKMLGYNASASENGEGHSAANTAAKKTVKSISGNSSSGNGNVTTNTAAGTTGTKSVEEATKQLKSLFGNKSCKVSGPREMTDEEKKGYNKLVANAKQMSLPL